MRELLSLEAAQERLLALAVPLPVASLPIGETLGRFLFEPLTALRTQPAADLSAMDGYAVVADTLAGPWRVIGESAAGHPFAGSVGPGEAARISTGAMLPEGAGVVLLQEDCAREGDRLSFTGSPPSPSERHIRRAGMDFSSGETLLPAGTGIGPAQIALAIAAGHGHLTVRREPRIAIIDGGDELAAPGAPCPPHHIPASNGAMLVAIASGVPCHIVRLGPVADDVTALLAALDQAQDADVIVTSGGASVGDHDLIGPALTQWGATTEFWKVAIKPGKPLLVARRGAQIVLGLPGNPVSSLVTAYLFLLPLLRGLLGADLCLPRAITTRLAGAVPATAGRREFLRARWDGRDIAAGTTQDSGALASLAVCNALINRPPHSPGLAVGAEVSAYLLANGGMA